MKPEELKFTNDKFCRRCGGRIPDKYLDCPQCFGIPPDGQFPRKPNRTRKKIAEDRAKKREQNPELPMDGEIRVK